MRSSSPRMLKGRRQGAAQQFYSPWNCGESQIGSWRMTCRHPRISNRVVRLVRIKNMGLETTYADWNQAPGGSRFFSI